MILDKDFKKETVLKLAHTDGQLFRATVRWSFYDSRKNTRHVGFQLAQSAKDWILADSP